MSAAPGCSSRLRRCSQQGLIKTFLNVPLHKTCLIRARASTLTQACVSA